MKRNNNSTTIGRFALSCVAAAALSVTMGDAQALGLGSLSVQSALGQGLRAEIDVTSMTPEEAQSLSARVAPPQAYQAAGVDYNAVLPATKVTLERRANGRPYLRIISDRVVHEPFVDLILELAWSNGQLTREYTLLFDPPEHKASETPVAITPPVSMQPPQSTEAAVAEPVPPVVSPGEAAPSGPQAEGPSDASPPDAGPSASVGPSAEPAGAEPVGAEPVGAEPQPPVPQGEQMTEERPSSGQPAARQAAVPAAPNEPASVAAPSDDGAVRTEVKVNPGETLSRIAARVQQPGVSLDQMVVSLYRANPHAFVADNMNRLKAGAVLAVPDADQAQVVTPQEARQLIRVQSADFDAYRQRVAAAAAAREAGDEPGRVGAGTVEADVEDRREAQAPTSDRLTLTKAAVSPKASASEDGIAEQRAKQEAEDRLAELNRNTEDLKRLSASAGTAAAAGAASDAASSAEGLGLPASDMAEAASEAPDAASAEMAAASDAASEPSMSASESETPEAAASESAAQEPQAEVAAEEPGFLAGLLDNPLLLPVAGGLVLLLGGLGGYRAWAQHRKKKLEAGETSFLESKLQPDSFFGVTGGSHVDTSEAGGESALGYSLSQLDANGDADPVAEADVYLAYGRDLQAEEILKEAMRLDPDRLALRTKMLEVYAKRRDIRGFEVMAGQLRMLTGGQGEDWERARELGASLDPENVLYKPRAGSAADGHPDGAGALDAAAAVAAGVAQATDGVDLDLNESADLSKPRRNGLDLETTRPMPSGGVLSALDGLQAPPAQAPVAKAEVLDNSLAFDLSDFKAPAASSPAQAPAPAAAPSMDFQLSGMGLDFDDMSSASQPQAGQADGDDPLAQKLDLANEFAQIGDQEGARELLNEVLAQAQGPLKARAQALLDEMA